MGNDQAILAHPREREFLGKVCHIPEQRALFESEELAHCPSVSSMHHPQIKGEQGVIHLKKKLLPPR